MSAAELTRVERTAAALLPTREARLASGSDWPAYNPLPALPDTEAPSEFPVDGLGPLLGPATRAIAEAVQVPTALAAGSVLAAAAVAAQPHADVLLPQVGRVPLSLYMVTCAESGDRKSAVDAVASLPIEEQRRRDARAFAAEDVERRSRTKKHAPGESEEPAPAQRSLVVSKATMEGLHDLLRHQSSIGLLSPEGAELIAGHSMRQERRAAGVAWLLKGWGGETLDTLTRGQGLSVLLGRRVSLHVMVQPVILENLLADPLAAGQGLIVRCLIAAPVSLAGQRLFREEALPAAEQAPVRRYYEQLERLVRAPTTSVPGSDGFELAPRALVLDEEARGLWIEFYDTIERDQVAGRPLSCVRPFASKAAEHAARIAGVIAMLNGQTAISGPTMLGAIRVVDFYLGEHLRLHGHSLKRLRFKQLQALASWMASRGPQVRHDDVLQASPRPLRALKAAGLLELLTDLANRGYIRRAGDVWEVRHAD